MRLLPLGVLVCGISFAFAACKKDDGKVDAKDVPAAVAKTITDKYPKGVVTGWTKDVDDKGVAEYEADVSIGDGKKKRDLDVKLAADGTLLKEEEKMEFKSLPDGVRAAFEKSAYGKSKVNKVERVVRNGDESKVTYELKVKDAKGESTKLTLDANGAITTDDKPAAVPAVPAAPEAPKSNG